jgi:hypothetical protein
VQEWLAPLPDKSLPSLEVRESILKVLRDQFIGIESSIIRKSGIGKALMLIYKLKHCAARTLSTSIFGIRETPPYPAFLPSLRFAPHTPAPKRNAAKSRTGWQDHW